MSRLLSADLHRLLKNKSFYLVAAGIFIFQIIVMYFAIRNDKLFSDAKVIEDYYYQALPYAGLILSAFMAMFVGTEHSDGTIRNKIAVGHRRIDICLADFITCTAAAGVFLIALALGGLTGMQYFGLWSAGMKTYFLTLLTAFFTLLPLISLFGIIVHMVQSRSVGAIAAVFLSIAFIYAGSYFYNSLQEPETICEFIRVTDDGNIEYGDEVANQAYIGGTKREVYQVILRLLPTGQQILLADEPLEQPLFMIVCSSIITIIAIIAGLWCFQKKDLK